jgi:hypothetical protein
MYNQNMKKIALQLLIGLVLIAAIWIGLSAVNRNFSNMFAPLTESSHAMSTQISDLLHPTPTILPDPVTIIHDVRSLARLETIQYTVEKVITAELGNKDFDFLFEDRLLLVAHGYVIAGVDLSKLEPADMWLDNGVLKVRLPVAEVFVATLDNEKTYVYERDTGLLRKPIQNLETLARQSAEVEIRKAAIEDGILNIAQQNAESFLTQFFISLGYPDVIFVK